MNTPDNNQYKAAFFIVPSYILDIPNLTLAFLKVYETIFQFWNHSKPCYLSLEVMSQRTGVGKSQICEALNFFEDCGELIRRKKGGRRYFIQPERGIPDDCTENVPESGPADSRVRRSGQRLSGGADNNNKKLNKEINKNINISPIFENEVPENQYPETYYDKPQDIIAKKEEEVMISEMLKFNPFQITELLIRAWYETQKKKRKIIHSGIWALMIQDLYKYSEAGLDPREAFETMVKKGWDSLDCKKAMTYAQAQTKAKGTDKGSTGWSQAGILNARG